MPLRGMGRTISIPGVALHSTPSYSHLAAPQHTMPAQAYDLSTMMRYTSRCSRKRALCLPSRLRRFCCGNAHETGAMPALVAGMKIPERTRPPLSWAWHPNPKTPLFLQSARWAIPTLQLQISIHLPLECQVSPARSNYYVERESLWTGRHQAVSGSSMNTDRQQLFTEQFVKCNRRLFGFVITLLPNFDEAEDAHQETCLRIWAKWDEYDSSRDFLAWACGFAKNVVRELRQKKSHGQALLSEQAMERIAEIRFRENAVSDAWQSRLADCLQELSDEQRNLLARHYARQEPMLAIAEELRTTNAALYKRMSRTRRLLFECLEQAAGRRLDS
jgi:RNA polymerase sigma-70 factor, ECF subfamily